MKIVKKMPNTGRVKAYTVGWGRKAKVYTQDGQRVTRTRGEIQDALVTRAEELAATRGYSGAGRFARVDYERALAEVSPEERAIERDVGPSTAADAEAAELERWRHANPHVKRDEDLRRLANQAIAKRRAYLHQDELAATYVRQGKAHTLAEAWAMANRAAPEIAKQAGLPIEQDYGAGPGVDETTHEAALRKSRDVVVRQVAADALVRGLAQPDGYSREWVDHYFAVTSPPPPPVAGTNNQAALDRYNTQREQFVDGVLQDARRLLADPAERAKLTPVRLGR